MSTQATCPALIDILHRILSPWIHPAGQTAIVVIKLPGIDQRRHTAGFFGDLRHAHDAVEKEEDQRIKSQEPGVIDFINCRWKMGFEWNLTFVKQNKTKRIHIYIHILDPEFNAMLMDFWGD